MPSDIKTVARNSIDRCSSMPPAIPPGHVGEFVIPATGQRIWWTGRVAIGLLHQAKCHDATAQAPVQLR